MKAIKCRGCNSGNLFTIHDFGMQPLAGNYPLEPNSFSKIEKYELDLTQCKNCGLLQVMNLPPIELVFNDNYRYSSSTIPALVNHFKEYSLWLAKYIEKDAEIIEFGCNDGILLSALNEIGYKCIGIDASDNMAAIAREKGFDVVTGFLNYELINLKGYANRFDLVTCSNVLAHIDDLLGTVDSVKKLLKIGGLFAIEVHDGDLIRLESQFDTIYHEHLTYFTKNSLIKMLSENGFEYIDCEKTKMHGGGLRLIARYTKKIQEIELIDSDINISNFIYPKLNKSKEELNKLYLKYGPLDGYGAAGRSQMFINMTSSEKTFNCIYDDSEFRQNRYIAGTDIKIKPYNNEIGECIVILAWNYAEDIILKIRENYKNIYTILPALTKLK